MLLLLVAGSGISAGAAELSVQDFYEKEENGFASLVWEENKAYDFFSDATKMQTFAAVRSTQVLPEAYDVREQGVRTQVFSQGLTSACWAIAATDAVMHCLLLNEHPVQPLSPAHLVWFAHRSLVYSSGRDSGDGTIIANPFTHGGNWVDAAVTLARWSGPALQSAFPFDGSKISSMGNYAEEDRYEHKAVLTDAACYYAKNSDVKSELGTQELVRIKQAILRDGVAQTSFYSDGVYYNDSVNGMCYYQDAVFSTNHAVLLVGWDDSFARENFSEGCRPQQDGAWLCKNSWGEAWGDEGYFWLSYEDVSLNQIVSYAAQPAAMYADNYQYDGFGFHGRLFSDSYIRYVNVFTADEDMELAAVATWFLQDAAAYKISVYKSPDAEHFPVSEYCAASVSGTQDTYGYHLVSLQTPVAIRAGEVFSVAVELTATAACPQVNAPIENSNSSDYVSYSRPGQSFVQVSRDGQWYDTSEEGLNNVCIKAFTAHTHEDAQGDAVCDICTEPMSMKNMFFYRRLLELFWAVFANFDKLLLQE